MTPRSFFNIVIKILGLLFLKDIVQNIPQWISFVSFFTREDLMLKELWNFIFTVIIIGFFIFLVFQLLFKTNYIIDKLKLDQGFNQDEFSLNISLSKVLTIALFLIAGLILINEIPNFCRQLFLFFQEMRIKKPNPSFLIISAVKIIIGLLIIGEKNRIVNFVEK